jgi:hypothetical protein
MKLFKMEFTVTAEEAAEVGQRLVSGQSLDEVDHGTRDRKCPCIARGPGPRHLFHTIPFRGHD